MIYYYYLLIEMMNFTNLHLMIPKKAKLINNYKYHCQDPSDCTYRFRYNKHYLSSSVVRLVSNYSCLKTKWLWDSNLIIVTCFACSVSVFFDLNRILILFSNWINWMRFLHLLLILCSFFMKIIFHKVRLTMNLLTALCLRTSTALKLKETFLSTRLFVKITSMYWILYWILLCCSVCSVNRMMQSHIIEIRIKKYFNLLFILCLLQPRISATRLESHSKQARRRLCWSIY